MKLIAEPIIKNQKITNPLSQYSPGKDVIARFVDIKADFEIADSIRNNDYEEFGGGSQSSSLDLITYVNKMQKRFNLNIPSATDDPNQDWRANTIRPITRNKVISIVAHLTQSILYPTIVAQNDDSEEDKAMATVMRDCIEWACEQSQYEDEFLKAIIDLCVNPAVFMYQDFADVKRKIKEIKENGKWKLQEVVDEIYSGFISQVVPIDEVYIGNVYEPNIQKQPFIIWRRIIGYNEVLSKYGHLDNFKYVQPSLRVFFNSDDGLFYDDYDEELEDRLCEEITYYNRNADLEIRIVNGVMMDDPDQPIRRKDKLYPLAKSYYEEFNSRFFYGMPLVAKMMPDQDIIDTLYNMIIDGTFLQIMPPTAIYGTEEIDSSVMIPGRSTAFRDVNSRVDIIGTGSNLNAGMNVLQKVENSLSESSQDPLQSGQQGSGDRTKYEVVRLEQNARTVLGLTGKAVSRLVREFGNLLTCSIVQYMPVAEISEVVGDDVRLKFANIVLPNKNIDGTKKSRVIKFSTDMPESAEQEREMGFNLLQDEGYNPKKKDKGNKSIAIVNPDAFRRMKYLIKVEPDFVDRATKFYKKIQLYDRAIGNPMADPEVVTRELLFGSFVPGEEEKYMKKQGMEQNPIMQQVAKNATNPMPLANKPMEASQEQI